MTVLPVSFTFISVCAATMILFGAWIGTKRGSLGVLRGDGGDEELSRRIRIHANFMEYAPLFALVLLAAEVCGASALWLWIAVAAFFVGRIWHFVRFNHADRAFGILVNTLAALALAVFVLLCTTRVI